MKVCPVCHRCLEDPREVCPEDGAPLEDAFGGSCVLDRRYRLLRRLGSGGWGEVYKARHLGIRRLVAVKVLHPRYAEKKRFVARFEREAEALGRLRHPNIVEVTDFGVDAERRFPFLVMEYLEGISLARKLRREGPLEIAAALKILTPVARAVDHAHRQGVLHRDLKPSNVFLTRTAQVKVLDFGLARFLTDPEETPASDPGATRGALGDADGPPTSAETTPGTALGTPGYQAPEVRELAVPMPASDIFAFGALTYATLLGYPPGRWRRSTAPRGGVGHDVPSSHRADLAGLDEALLSPLARDPAERPPSALRVLDALRRAHVRARERCRKRRERSRHLVLAGVLGLVAALLGLAVERPLRRLDEAVADAWLHWTPPRAPHHPLTLVLIDEETLASDPAPLIEKGDEFGRLLGRALEGGARGVGIDVLLPEPWSRSPGFSDLVLRHSSSLVLAAFSPPGGAVIGGEAVSGLTAAALGASRARRLFGFVNLDPDHRGAVRRVRRSYRDVEGTVRSSFSSRAAEILVGQDNVRPARTERSVRIDFTLDWRRFEQISWGRLAEALDRDPERFRDRFLVVGATYASAGDGPIRVPHPRSLPAEVPGPMLRALAIHTLADGGPLREAPRTATLAGLFLAAALGAATVLRTRLPGRVSWTLPMILAAWVCGAYACFALDRVVLPVAPAAVGLGTTFALTVLFRRLAESLERIRREAMSPLQRYLIPPTALLLTCLIGAGAALPVGAAGSAPQPARESSDKAVALVSWIYGEAVVRPPAAAGERAEETSAEPLAVLGRLSPGSIVRTARRARVWLVFFNGDRFVLEAESQASIEEEGVELETGSVRRLEPVPSLIELPPLADSERPGRRSGSGRIRLAGHRDAPYELSPRSEMVLASDTTLRFTPVVLGETYRVEVVSESGELVFSTETSRPQVRLLPGVLRPGVLYYWEVSSPRRLLSGRRAPTGRRTLLGRAHFVTLSEREDELRRGLAERVGTSEEPGLRLLLAEVDFRLGLVSRACEGLGAVPARQPDTQLLDEVAHRFGCGARP